MNGALVSSPSFVLPRKNSTFATLPLSVAFAAIVSIAGDTSTVSVAGAVMLTVGGTGTFTDTLSMTKLSTAVPLISASMSNV